MGMGNGLFTEFMRSFSVNEHERPVTVSVTTAAEREERAEQRTTASSRDASLYRQPPPCPAPCMPCALRRRPWHVPGFRRKTPSTHDRDVESCSAAPGAPRTAHRARVSGSRGLGPCTEAPTAPCYPCCMLPSALSPQPLPGPCVRAGLCTAQQPAVTRAARRDGSSPVARRSSRLNQCDRQSAFSAFLRS